MIYLLDTNTCIAYLNGTAPNVEARLRATSPDDITLCSVVKAELLFGAAKSVQSMATKVRLYTFFSRFASAGFDDAAADHYGHVRAHLARNGTPIGPNDLLIASITLAQGFTLVTHNTREFSRVPGLAIEDWHQ